MQLGMFYVDNDVMICQTRLSWLQTRSVYCTERVCSPEGWVGPAFRRSARLSGITQEIARA